jgi:hypothetical protein
MCGLFGWIGRIPRRQRAVIAATLAAHNAHRGTDSWGAALGTPARRSSYFVVRGLGSVGRVPQLLQQYSAVMAHSRAATQGKITLENAHPFERGNVALAHNGMIFNAKTVAPHCDVDSEILAERIAARKDFADLDGYGVVTWLHRPTGTIWLSHVGGGQIALAEIYDGRGLAGCIWSSDRDHLADAIAAAGLATRPIDVPTGAVFALSRGGAFRTARKLVWAERKVTKFQRKERHMWHSDDDSDAYDDWLAKYRRQACDTVSRTEAKADLPIVAT